MMTARRWGPRVAWATFGLTAAAVAGVELGAGQAATTDTTWSLAAVGDAIITRRIAQFDNESDVQISRDGQSHQGC